MIFLRHIGDDVSSLTLMHRLLPALEDSLFSSGLPCITLTSTELRQRLMWFVLIPNIVHGNHDNVEVM